MAGRGKHIALLGVGLASALVAGVYPAAACQFPATEKGTVASVIDGETLALTDGRAVRLIGAKAPAAPLGWRGDDPWPFVEDAKQAVARLASGADIELGFGERREDRHGHLLAQVFVVRSGTRLWLQGELVGQGLGRVYSFADARACVSDLLSREAEARAKRLGIWGSWAYRVEDALDLKRLDRLMHSYQLVEGTVVAVGEGRGRLYLNFTQDWRSDFTLSVERKDVPRFTAAAIDLSGLAGKRLRVRGWLQWRAGPAIEATHPEQLEILPNASQADAGMERGK